MPRKYESTEGFLQPDPRFGSKLVSRFINCLMMDGKKTTAQKVFYGALDLVTQKIPGEDPLEVFHTALSNVKPIVEVRSRRVGGATLQVPHEVGRSRQQIGRGQRRTRWRRSRQQSLAIRWMLDAARAKKGKPMAKRLAEEIFDAYNKQGVSYTKRENTHKMAEANEAFAHFAW